MKSSLPANHGLPEICAATIFQEADQASITDVQHAALTNGIGRGASALVLAPTSTGKTHIGIWALMSWIAKDPTKRRGIYLVTHRSLANQKFEEFRRILLGPLFSDSGDALVLATGERQEDANGAPVTDPLRAPLLIATYEKYLGLLCGSGIPTDLRDVCIVADEVQIIGDKYRGVNVEILLTLIKGARPGQFVGLSAVIAEADGRHLADWLGVQLVRVPHREKHLRYECRSPTKIASFSTGNPGQGIAETQRKPTQPLELIPLLRELMARKSGKPIVVFCMRKQDVYQGSRDYCRAAGLTIENAPLLAGLSVDTSEGKILSGILPHRMAIHCADLIEEDRAKVEEALASSEVDLVFATSTLAAGVNFPIGTVVFYSWTRWNFGARASEAISSGEFHNMAGRCGRMGTEHEAGEVIFTCGDGHRDVAAARRYLTPDQLDGIDSHISSDHFLTLLLQLAASGVVKTEADALAFLKATFGAARELAVNAAGLNHWDLPFQEAVKQLREWSFIR